MDHPGGGVCGVMSGKQKDCYRILHSGGTLNPSIKNLAAISSLLLILQVAAPALAIEFDVWKTGMTLS